MSDISFTFPWYAYPMLLVMFTWPGLLIGLLVGGLLWRRHRIWGAILGALVGCLLWAGGLYLWT